MKKIKKFLGNMKLRYKLMLIYFCIGFFPFMILGLVFYEQVSDLLIEEEKMSSSNLIHQSIQSFDSSLMIYDNLSDYLSFNQGISNTLSYQYDDTFDIYEQVTEIIDPLINSIQYFHNDVNKITIYSREDIVKHDTILAPISEIKDEEWYSEIINSSDIKWYSDGDDGILFSVRKMPLLDRSGIEGILYIEIDAKSLFTYFDSLDISDYSVFITDSYDHVLYEYQNFSDESEKLTYDELREKRVSSHDIISEKSDVTDWKVYFYRPNIAGSKRLHLIYTIIILVVVLIAIAMCMLLLSTSQIITGRIERLMKNMQDVEKGELEVHVEGKYDDEIGTLIDSFKKMVERIRHLIEEVYLGKLYQKEYELRALQQQINPHFLYNTLSMINFKALEVGEKDISKITLALSSFYRTSLNKGKNTCSIKDEINNMESYMEIQLMLHDYNFDFEYDIDDSILECETLNLILQPIVENSIKHGIDLIEDDRRGIIKVYATKEDDQIYIMVEDNGVGMDQETIEIMLSQNSKGYGMRNVNERIKLYYGEQYGVYIESVINEGTVITVKIPERKYK